MSVWPLDVLCADLRGLHSIVANEAADRLELLDAEVSRLECELASAVAYIKGGQP